MLTLVNGRNKTSYQKRIVSQANKSFYLLQQRICAKTLNGAKYKIIFNLTHKYNKKTHDRM